VSTISLGVAPYGECLRGEGLVWLIGAVVCLLAAAAGPMSVKANFYYVILVADRSEAGRSSASELNRA